MTALTLLVIFIIFAFVLHWYISDYDYATIKEPFSCGSDEICYCDKARDCQRADNNSSGESKGDS